MKSLLERAKELFGLEDYECSPVNEHEGGRNLVYVCCKDGEKQYVLKQIHHEPCSYYQFGNKMESELNDYKRLTDIGIRMPKLWDYDMEQERILKE